MIGAFAAVRAMAPNRMIANQKLEHGRLLRTEHHSTYSIPTPKKVPAVMAKPATQPMMANFSGINKETIRIAEEAFLVAFGIVVVAGMVSTLLPQNQKR